MRRIDRMTEGSWERVRQIRLRSLAEAPDMFGSNLAREQGFDETEWRRRAARPATFLARCGDADHGTAGIFEFSGGWYLMGMWVAPEARGTGVVGALIDACVRFARQQGADCVLLGVMEDNPRGIGAYERAGFVATGERTHVRDGRDELWMRRRLGK